MCSQCVATAKRYSAKALLAQGYLPSMAGLNTIVAKQETAILAWDNENPPKYDVFISGTNYYTNASSMEGALRILGNAKHDDPRYPVRTTQAPTYGISRAEPRTKKSSCTPWIAALAVLFLLAIGAFIVVHKLNEPSYKSIFSHSEIAYDVVGKHSTDASGWSLYVSDAAILDNGDVLLRLSFDNESGTPGKPPPPTTDSVYLIDEHGNKAHIVLKKYPGYFFDNDFRRVPDNDFVHGSQKFTSDVSTLPIVQTGESYAAILPIHIGGPSHRHWSLHYADFPPIGGILLA